MKRIVFLLISALMTISVSGQDLLTIGKKNITPNEFKYIYKKNNNGVSKENSVDEYLKLFVNFKLIVVEAENLKMDTAASFIKEYNGYKDQLSKPYLSENQKYEEYTKEAYKASQQDIKLDILFVKMPPKAEPKDTLLAYNKALKIRQRIIGGEDFEKVVLETSDDRSKNRNKGHLSFLPLSRIPFNLQKFVKSNASDEISTPLKTGNGYYLLKVVDKRKNPGQVKVAHIMMTVPKDIKAKDPKIKKAKLDSINKVKKERIDSIYNALKNGADFKDLVKLSDDRGTAKKGGELNWFSTGRMVPEFEAAAFSLKNKGDFTKPVKTSFGWHIIKLIDKKGSEKYDEAKDKLRKTIERDPVRTAEIQKSVANILKVKYNFKEYHKINEIYKLIDSSVFKAKWKLKDDELKINDKLFRVENTSFQESDFGLFIENNQKRRRPINLKIFVDEMYEKYVYKMLVEQEKADLMKTQPQYKYLMREYHDGMLLFELKKKEIWDKAVEDSIGLKKFYEANKDKYSKQIKMNLSIFKYGKSKFYKKTAKLLTNSRSKYNDTQIVTKIAGNDKSKLQLITNGSLKKGDNKYADKVIKMYDDGKLKDNQKIMQLKDDNILIYINSKEITKDKDFSKIKGIVISDYQNKLEKEWLKKLHKKYNVKINKSVLNKVKKELKK